jgi:hypothetical protein
MVSGLLGVESGSRSPIVPGEPQHGTPPQLLGVPTHATCDDGGGVTFAVGPFPSPPPAGPVPPLDPVLPTVGPSVPFVHETPLSSVDATSSVPHEQVPHGLLPLGWEFVSAFPLRDEPDADADDAARGVPLVAPGEHAPSMTAMKEPPIASAAARRKFDPKFMDTPVENPDSECRVRHPERAGELNL